MAKSAFDYQLRESPRAKNVRLKVTPQHGLEIIVPRGYNHSHIRGLLERKQNWIRTALERTESFRQFFEPQPVWQLPHKIHLPAIGHVFHIEAQETQSARVIVRIVATDRIRLIGCINDERACQAALSRWLARLTKEHLVPRLSSLSIKMQLNYRHVLVRRQKTRWASCSKHQTISLNLKLLFLPPTIVDYVLIHELCHLSEMNHSKRFWAIVEKHCPHYRILDTELREMWKVIPRWLMSYQASSGMDLIQGDL